MLKSFQVVIGILLTILLFPCHLFAVDPQSDNYKLRSYDFGGGGVVDATDSSGNTLRGIIGAYEGSSSATNTNTLGAGLLFTEQAHVPPAPTFTNPGNTYNRLKIIINTGNNPSDALFAIAITDDNWTTTQYVQSDATVGPTLAFADRLTYTGWGGATGRYITGLANGTTYKVRVNAMQVNGTESGWGPEATAATGNPSLSFGVDQDAIIFNELTLTNSLTDDTKSTVLTTSTNAYNGYIVYAHETDQLRNGIDTIGDYVSANASPTTWAGFGFGYSTNDSNLIGGTADRFTNGGPKYAGFTTSIPGDPVADHPGPIADTPIVNEQFTIGYRVTAQSGTKAGAYTNRIIYSVVPAY